MAGLLKKISRCAQEILPAVIQGQDPVRPVRIRAEIVTDPDYPRSTLPGPGYLPEKYLFGIRVQPAARLVQKKYPRRKEKYPGQAEPLGHAPGKTPGLFPGRALQTNPL
jgi:hypothetical protein